MALTAKLQFGDNQAGRYNKDYLLVDCRCSFRRSHNDLRPDGLAYCDMIEVSLVAPERDDMTLHNWFIEEDELSGRIVFDLSTITSGSSNPTKELRFEDAHCFAMEESYDKDTRFRRLLKLAFEADSITMDDIDFIKQD